MFGQLLNISTNCSAQFVEPLWTMCHACAHTFRSHVTHVTGQTCLYHAHFIWSRNSCFGKSWRTIQESNEWPIGQHNTGPELSPHLVVWQGLEDHNYSYFLQFVRSWYDASVCVCVCVCVCVVCKCVYEMCILYARVHVSVCVTQVFVFVCVCVMSECVHYCCFSMVSRLPV